jgi:pyruvate dehydrogenase phosphatase
MTSEEATLLLTAYSDEPAAPAKSITKSQLARKYHYLSPREPRPWPAEDLPGSREGDETDTWTFGDENAALHLIRNSLGPGNTDERKWRLSANLRKYRDDASAM